MEQIDFKKNSLNTFRLLAAIEVLYGHTLTHLELNSVPLFGDFIGLFWGVPLFFTLSGFLIWHSIEHSASFGDYAKKRFWRIYPELWVAVGVEIIVLLLLYHEPIDWAQFGLFIIGQSTIFQFWTPDCLRDYGCGCPNGSLWTITVLIEFYFLAYFIHKLLHNRHVITWIVTIVVTIIIGWLTPFIRSSLPVIVGKLYGCSIFPYLWMFLLAAFVNEYKDKILPVLKRYWWAFVTILLLLKLYHWDIRAAYPLFGTILLFCGLLGFSYMYPEINIKKDISYGIYIYHMTVVNALIALGVIGRNWTLWLVIILTCLLAYVSTITIGQLSATKKKSVATLQV